MNICNFKDWSILNKLSFLEGEFDLGSIKTTYNDPYLFFRDIFIDSQENAFVKKRALELIINYTLLGEIPVRKTIGFLLDDVTQSNDLFILVCCLKNLYLFYENEPNEIESFYLKFESDEIELISECRYALGVISFFKAIDINDQLCFRKTISESRSLFVNSYNSIENRDNAAFFIAVCDIISVVRYEPLVLESHIKTIQEILWKRNILSLNYNNLGLENTIYRVVVNLAKINKANPASWIEYRNEFHKLCSSLYEIKNIELKNRLFESKLISILVEDIVIDNIEPFFIINFKAQKIKIEECLKIKNLYESEKDLLTYIYSLIDISSPIILEKEKLEAIKKLQNAYPLINVKDIDQILSFDNSINIINQILKIFEQQRTDFTFVLSQIMAALVKLQGDFTYKNASEDVRNTNVRNLLEMAGLLIKDQSLWGKSKAGSNSGEVDIIIQNKERLPCCIIEALNLNSLKQDYLNTHITKLYGYDPNGVENNIILVYSEAVNFSEFWIRYVDYIKTYSIGFTVQSFFEENSGFGNIKILKIEYIRNCSQTNLYHIVVNFNY